MKRKIFLSIIIIGILGIIVFINYKQRIVYNDDDVVGNTAGNLINGGLFCEYDNKIYFANSNDSDRLYSMNSNCTNFKKITSCSAEQINVAGKYLYYSIPTNSSNSDKSSDLFGSSKKGLYRAELNGNNISTIYRNSLKNAVLSGNYLYYQHYDNDTGINIYRVKMDDNEGSCIMKSEVSPVSIDGTTFYYAGVEDDHNIYKFNTEENSSDIVSEGNYGMVTLSGDYLYYLDIDQNYSIGRMKLDGSEKETLVKERVSSYNISLKQKYLYYQVDNGTDNRICQINLDTMGAQTLLEGNFNSIHVTSTYVFFKEFDTDQIYLAPVENTPTVSMFNPPVK